MKTKETPFPNGTRIRDILNDGLVLTIIGHEAKLPASQGTFFYYASDPSIHVPDWILSHDEILTGTHYDEKRWTVLDAA